MRRSLTTLSWVQGHREKQAAPEPQAFATPAGGVDKRERIMAAGLRLFAERPYQQVTMDRVAEASGVAKGTLYLYFESKESLYMTILREGMEGAIQMYTADINPSLGVAERLKALIAANVRFYYERRNLLRLIATEEPRLEARNRLMKDWRERRLRRFRSLIEEGVAAGVFAPLDPNLAALAITGAIRSVLLDPRTNPSAAEIAHHLSSLALDGLRADAARHKALSPTDGR